MPAYQHPGFRKSTSSTVLEFRYAEKSGPELVEAAVFGYHADLLNQNSGLAVVRF